MVTFINAHTYDNYARITIHSVGHGRDLEATSDSTVTTAGAVAGQQNAGPVRKDGGANPFGTIYARLTMRKVMASLFERVLVSREVGDLTDGESPGISRLPKGTNVTRMPILGVGLKRIDMDFFIRN